MQRGEDFFDLLLRRAERRHDDDDVADRPRQHAALGQAVADADPSLLGQLKRLACPPVANQFNRQHASRLPDVTDLRQAPKPLGFGVEIRGKFFAPACGGLQQPDTGQAGGTAELVAGVAVPVKESLQLGIVAKKRIEHFLRCQRGGHRQIAAG